MKNDSWLFPFSRPEDKFFDSNKDGKLSGFETIFRDAYIVETERKFIKNKNKNSNS